MKLRFFLILLCLSLLLSGCTLDLDDEPTDGPSDGTQDGTQNGGQTDPEDSLYLDIYRYVPSASATNKIAFRGSERIVSLTVPDEWVLCEREEGLSYDIKRDGVTVGTVFSGKSTDFSEWRSVKSDSKEEDGLLSQMFIERYGSGDTLRFRYRFRFEYADGEKYRIVTLIADCAEISDSTADYLLAATIADARDEVQMGELYQEGDPPSSVLVLGNSFIGSSAVGVTLQEMIDLGGKRCQVTAVTRGYATVATYINDPLVMQSIRAGAYDAVFICGFYSQGEIANLGILKEACDASDTPLVIFPAHNENAAVVSAAKDAYPSLLLLNWKGEIDALITANGLSKWDFCVDDAHDHSTESAGYVGAHMIYRALYGEVPTGNVSQAISQTYIDRLLGSYVSTGYVPGEKNDVNYFD